MRVYSSFLFAIAILGGCAMASGPAQGGPPTNVTEFQEKQVVKRAFIQTVAKYAPKAATLIVSANSAIKNQEFKRTVIIGLDEIRMEIKQLKTSMEKKLFEATIADTRTKNIVGLVQDIDKIASGLDRKTQIANFMKFTTDHSLVDMMKGVEQLILKSSMNILDVTMNSDKYHRKTTLDDTQDKIDSMMRTIIFSYALRVSIQGNSTKMVEYIEQRWNKANSSSDISEKLANNTLGEELDYIDIAEPEGLQNFATLMHYYEIVTKSVEEQIANKLHEDCYHKIAELVEITMKQVLKKDIDDVLEEMKEKIARMKENLDAMYTNDRYFVAAYQSERLWLWSRIEHNHPYSQKEFFTDAQNHRIVVFRAEPSGNFTAKLPKKESGHEREKRPDCITSTPGTKSYNGSRIVIGISGVHEMVTDLDYARIYDDTSECDYAHGEHNFRLEFKMLQTSYVIYG